MVIRMAHLLSGVGAVNHMQGSGKIYPPERVPLLHLSARRLLSANPNKGSLREQEALAKMPVGALPQGRNRTKHGG